ncbi:hypothetical protein JCM11641_007334 [Rhodosporidiobolus odoratus]
MSDVFGSDPGISSGASWIAPDYAEILDQVKNGQSPYLYILGIVQGMYHPTVPWGFRTSLGVSNGLYGISIIITIGGLAIRILTSRFWIFHRLDRTILLPNTSVIYGICSLCYLALGMVVVVGAVQVTKNEDYPKWYIGARSAWIGPLFLGCFCESWATVCAWYIRKKGAFYRESYCKTFIASVLPFVLLFTAWISPTVLFYMAAINFNHSYRVGMDISADLRRWQADWTPEKGLEMDKLLTLFDPGAELGNALIAYTDQTRLGTSYCAGVLILTFIVYITGAWLEISHLGSTVSQLQQQAFAQGNLPPRSSSSTNSRKPFRKTSVTRSATTAPTPPVSSPPIGHALVQQLDEEHFARADGKTEAVQHPWRLLSWARRNRIWTATCIATMLLSNAGLQLWQALTPLDLRYPSGQFQIETLASCWLNGILSTLVALLLLFRSLDATSSSILSSLRHHLPFLPFPPAVTPTACSLVTTEPPRFAYGNGHAVPLVERITTRSLVGVEEAVGMEEGKVVPVFMTHGRAVWQEAESVKEGEVHGSSEGKGGGSSCRSVGDSLKKS